MGIKFDCVHCGRTLNVKDFLAGKRGICPKCGGRIEIPAPGANGEHTTTGLDHSRAEAGATEAGAPDPIAESPQSKWFVLPAGSTRNYGPAVGDAMRQWIREGRVGADALVWREGWSEWRKAAVAFPQLAATTPTVVGSLAPVMVASPVAVQTTAAAAFAPVVPIVETAPPIVTGPSVPVASPAPSVAVSSAVQAAGQSFTLPTAQLARPQSATPFAPTVTPLITPTSAPGAPARAIVARRRSNTARNVALVVLVLAVIGLAIPLVWVLANQ